MKTTCRLSRFLRAAAAAAALALSVVPAATANTNFSYRIDCEVQNPSGSLEPLVWEQGTTPLVEVRVLRQNRVVPVTDTTVRMIVGPSATGNYFAAVSNNVWTDSNTCMIQWPSIGTNSMETGSWWYGITFHNKEGRIYWTGSGSLDIQPTLSNGEDGLIWQYYADSTERVTYITTNITHVTNIFITTNIYIYTNLSEFVTSVNGQTGDVVLDLSGIEENAAAIKALEEGKLPAHDEMGPWWVDAETTWPFPMNILGQMNISGGQLDVQEDGDHTSHWPRLEGGIATNAERIAGVDARIDSLWGLMLGGWHYPDYFYIRDVKAGTSEGAAQVETVSAGSEYNVKVAVGQRSVYKGWEIDTEVIRQSDWTKTIQWGDDIPESARPIPPFIYTNNLVLFNENTVDFAELDAKSDEWMAEVCNRDIHGTLGDFKAETRIEWDPKQRYGVNWYKFAGPADGSLLAAGWNTLLVAASNGAAQGKTVHLRTWPEGYGNSTNHPPAGWNTNFWAAGLGDFSCISYHTDWKGVDSGVYRPITMVTPRHGILANHYKPALRSNTFWVSRSGEILTNRAIAYKNIRGDLSVARLEYAFSTNDITPATLLETGWGGYCYGSTNSIGSLFGFPVLGFDCAERGYLMNWTPNALRQGRKVKTADDGYFQLWDAYGSSIPFFRKEAVGGDSGSPVFWPIDGTNVVLIGCFHTPQTGPLPDVYEVNRAIAEWGDEERAVGYNLATGGWVNPDIPSPP